jgi:hypothetical protein
MNIADIIREIAGKASDSVLLATVTSVDLAAKTCEVVTLNDDMALFDIRLIANDGDGIFIIPTVSSVIGVCMINEIEGFISLYSQVDSIQYGDGSFDGFVKVGDLLAKLNTLENDINDLKTVFSTWATVPNDGGAALKAAAATWFAASLTPTVQADIENDKITHGNF